MDAGEFGAIAVLAVQLPLSSRTLKRLHPELAWDENTYILALISDQLANIAYGLGGGKGRKPKQIPRPKASKKKETKNHLDVSKVRVDAAFRPPPTISRHGRDGGKGRTGVIEWLMWRAAPFCSRRNSIT